MKAGIAIDRWKLSTFESHLAKAGFAYEVGKGVTKDTLLLMVDTTEVTRLADVIFSANAECQKQKVKRGH